ncbi:MAG TPA: DNA-binding response regulator, partial [Pseudomonas sp.]|nr:DNA-binding response regulator [Pseudomonas sp.]
MKDDVVPAYQPNSPRVLLLSASSSLNSTLRQHLYDCPDWTLSHASAPRGEVEAALVLLDVGSYDRDTNVHLLRQIGDTPVALVNAQPDQARRLVET